MRNIIDKIDIVEDKLRRLGLLNNCIGDFDSVIKEKENIKILKQKKSDLSRVVKSLDSILLEISLSKDELDKAEENFKELMGDKCPLCESEIA